MNPVTEEWVVTPQGVWGEVKCEQVLPFSRTTNEPVHSRLSPSITPPYGLGGLATFLFLFP